MTLDQLKYFSAAAKFEHVGKSAKSLNISVGSISTAILALEDELKCKLFRRERKRVYLNNEGKYLLEQAEDIFEKLNMIRKHLNGDHAEIQGRYRLAGSHFLSSHFLAEAWTKLQNAHSEVSGDLSSAPTVLVLDGLLRGTLDLGLCFSPLKHPDLEQTILYEGQLRLVVRKKHPILNSKKNFKLSNLSEYPAMIHKSAPGVDICETHPNFEKYKISPTIKCQFDNDDLAIVNLSKSDSWSLLPDIVLKFTKGLEAVPHPSTWSAPYSIAMVTRRGGFNQTISKILQTQLKALLG